MTDIENWLIELGLEKYVSVFSDAEIDFETLSDLEEDDLKDLGLPLGPRRKVWGAIQRLEDGHVTSPESSIKATSPVSETSVSSQSHDAERRHLTVMFVDLVGSTEMSTRIDPEDMRNVITGYQNSVAGVIARYEGFVARFMGDGVLCYFGWPRANEDDAERATRAGLEIVATIKNSLGPNGLSLACRVGIASGVVIVGDLIGTGASEEAAVVGETPNLAARLQSLAKPDQLVISHETQSLLGNVFELISLGTHELKGIAEPTEAFAVVEERTQQSRFDSRHLGVLTPIVGREREIELMLECWTKAQSSLGQMVIISGEAGIGKSRITKAVIDEIAMGEHIRMNYQCSPYHSESAFYPIIQQMNFVAGVEPSDGSEIRLDKLEKLIGKDPETFQLIAALIRIDATERYGPLGLTPAQQRSRTMKALADLTVKLAAETPLLIVFEDLHWVDPTTLELLDVSLEAFSNKKILILGTARPTFDYAFGGHPIVSRFSLNRLGKDQIFAVVNELAGGKTLPEEVLKIIADRTDGVPLFVEELTKTILESEVLTEESEKFVLTGPLDTLAIPSTLHDSLMARLDRLQPVKEVAQMAACIGREFNHKLLVSISSLNEGALIEALEGLIKAELIYRRGIPPEATYLFKHALVRDAAYESLLKERRRAIHKIIVSALELEQETPPELLAHHAESAGLSGQAIDLWETASKLAIARPAYDEAISHLKRAIALITPRLDEGEIATLEHAVSLQVQLAMSLLVRKGYSADETVSAFKKALSLAEPIGEIPMRYTILYGLWIGNGMRGQHGEAWEWAKELLEQAAVSSETAPLVVANRVAGAQRWMMGDFDEAGRYLNIARKLYDPVAHAGLAHRFGQDIAVTINLFTALNALMLGQTELAIKSIKEAEQLAKSTGHVHTICYLLAFRSLLGLMTGDKSDVERCAAEALAIAEEHNLDVFRGYMSLVTEIVAARNGDKSSIQRYIKANEAFTAANCTLLVPQILNSAARSALELGLRDKAYELATMAQNLIDQTDETYALSDLHRLQATLAKWDDDSEAEEIHLSNAIDVARRQGAKLWEFRAAIDLARLWQSQGKNKEAIALLEPIHDAIGEGDCLEDRAIAETLLSSLAL